jgi:hypothetical protein
VTTRLPDRVRRRVARLFSGGLRPGYGLRPGCGAAVRDRERTARRFRQRRRAGDPGSRRCHAYIVRPELKAAAVNPRPTAQRLWLRNWSALPGGEVRQKARSVLEKVGTYGSAPTLVGTSGSVPLSNGGAGLGLGAG